MTTTYEKKTNYEMFVFRVPVQLAEQAVKKADDMMISRSAVCRQALQKFIASEDCGNISVELPQS